MWYFWIWWTFKVFLINLNEITNKHPPPHTTTPPPHTHTHTHPQKKQKEREMIRKFLMFCSCYLGKGQCKVQLLKLKKIIYWQWQFDWSSHWLWRIIWNLKGQEKKRGYSSAIVSAISKDNEKVLDFAIFTKGSICKYWENKITHWSISIVH